MTLIHLIHNLKLYMQLHSSKHSNFSTKFLNSLLCFGEIRFSNITCIFHIFLVPFYYIEYGIAQLGALGVWKNSKSDRAQALADYKRALALGGSRPLPELFAAANISFRFDTEAFKPLVELIQTELAALK